RPGGAPRALPPLQPAGDRRRAHPAALPPAASDGHPPPPARRARRAAALLRPAGDLDRSAVRGGGVMGTWLLRRLLLMVPTLLGITLVTFVVIRLAPGDPVSAALGGDLQPGTMSAEAI